MADLLALTEVNEALQADMGQDVVADGAARQEQGRKLCGAADEGTPAPTGNRLGATARADVDGLSYPEWSVGESGTLMLEGLANVHRALALRTALAGGVDLNEYLADASQERLLLPLHLKDGSPQGGERLEGERAVFPRE